MPAAPRQAPTAQLCRLAEELKTLRAASGRTREAVETRTGINTASLYRIETARVRPQQRTLLTLLDLYGVHGTDRDRVLTLFQCAVIIRRTEHDEPDLSPVHQTYISFESEAHHLHIYQSLGVPRPAADRGIHA